MMKNKIKVTSIFIFLFLNILYICSAQNIKNKKTETFQVSGNCNKCKLNIESAANKKGIAKVSWNKDTKMISATYDSLKTTSDAILKNIALAGYDNEKFIAPNEAYSKLDECCQYIRISKSTKLEETTSSNNSTDAKNPIKIASAVNPLLDVYSAYFGLKDALVKGDGDLAAVKAKVLYIAIDEVQMEMMNTSQHNTWMKYKSLISYDAEHIKSTRENEHQREHFASLSKNMIEIMKIIKPEYSVYIDHCPMYNDGKGADWLSKDSDINNPYFGSQMLTCGKTTETIK